MMLFINHCECYDSFQMVVYVIVEFLDEKSVAIVPEIWTVEEEEVLTFSSRCLYPCSCSPAYL